MLIVRTRRSPECQNDETVVKEAKPLHDDQASLLREKLSKPCQIGLPFNMQDSVGDFVH